MPAHGFERFTGFFVVVREQRGVLLVPAVDVGERDAKILRMRYGLDGEAPMTLKQIGDRVRLSRERVRQIENEALQKLGEFMKRDFNGRG